jgi:hypothetical protein
MKPNYFFSFSFIPTNTNTDTPNTVSIYTKSINTNADNYSSKYGIPFECVEFIRRFFVTQCNYTFPSVIDAEDMFYTINMLINISNHHIIVLKTYQYPYGDEYKQQETANKIFSYLKPGSILFWKKTNNENFKYGHVALIVSANKSYVTIANQNLRPYIKTYNTTELIQSINNENSPFLGIKVIPSKLSEFLEPKMNNIHIIYPK